jgi:hypothetical protein
VKQNKIWPVLRDVIIVTVLTGLGGFIVGFASTEHNSPLYIYSLALSNSLFCIIGFTISGRLAVENRWRHLAIVAAIAWAVSIFNVIFFRVTIIQWAASAIAVAIFALIGGGISLLFKRKNPVEISSNAGDDKFYDQVARELQGKPPVAGFWTKAYAEMGGNDAKARALYIKYRVANLKEEERNAGIKLQREEEEHKKEEAKDRTTMKLRLMTICKKCGFAGNMDPAFIAPEEHGFFATTCKCPKCSHRFDWYYVPSRDFPKAQS